MSQKIKSGSSGKGDVSYVRATGPPPPVPMSPTPGLMRDGNQTPVSQMSNMDNDWDDRDEIRQRELEEARARATQMEKTMRWWSDCTANWREKWSKVRNERNKSREENRQLRAKLEVLVKECTLIKRQNQEITAECNKLKKQIGLEPKSVEVAPPDIDPANSVRKTDITSDNSSTGSNQNVENTSGNQGMTVNSANFQRQTGTVEHDLESEGSLAEEKVTLFELKLDEAQKTLIAERGDKSSLMKTIEKQQSEISAMKLKCEELKRSKQDSTLEITKLKEDHKAEISRLLKDIEDEAGNKSNVDKKLNEVRRELEKLQRENADEWGKRERLETEKFSLERENKKLRVQIKDMEELLDSKKQQTSAMMDSDVRAMQIDLSEKTKELNDLRHTHSKVKKTLQEKLTELDHTRRRAEQYEIEVKKLRSRIEELKKDLANAEDEVDSQTNLVRKQQRTNDELLEQAENLQVQLNHAQSRLKRSSQSALNTLVTGLKAHDPIDPADDEDSDDFDDETFS